MAEKIGRLASMHKNGPGLKKLGKASDERWYGPGYCGICGSRTFAENPHDRGVVPLAVRYWDPDDGWKMGVLCVGCGEDCTSHGPRPDDFACREQAHILAAERIDILNELYAGDLDGVWADQDDCAA